jgi:hypothetical protein
MDEINVPIVSPRKPEHRAGITILGAPDPTGTTLRLQGRNVFVSAGRRGIRVAVHFCNNRQDIDRSSDALGDALKG